MPDGDSRLQNALGKVRGNGFADFMLRLFVKGRNDIQNPIVRRRYGYLGSIYGLVTNLFVFAAKVTCAFVFGLGTLMADAINNASDIGMCVIALVSVWIASRPASDEHPYGSARFEYIASLVIALLVIMLSLSQVYDTAMGMYASQDWMSSYEPYYSPAFYIPFAVMLVSFLVKLSQFLLLSSLGRRASSMTMQATGKDARNDSVVSLMIALSLLLGFALRFNVDPIAALIVGLFVALSGVTILKDASGAILGRNPPMATVRLFADLIRSYPAVLGVHDLEMHTYGTSEIHAYVHAEVDSAMPIMTIRDEIDFIEKDMEQRTGIRTFIHIDPIRIGDPETSRYRAYVLESAREIDPDIAVNDFRLIVNSEDAREKMLIFDLVLPYDLLSQDRRVVEQIKATVKSLTSDRLTFDIDIDDMTADLLLMLSDPSRI